MNDTNKIHKDILDRLAQEPSVSSTVIQALYRWYFEPHDGEQTVVADNTEVLEAIADMKAELKSIIKSRTVATQNELTNTVIVETVDEDGNVGETEAVEIELSEIDPDENSLFVEGLKRNMRPGMRLEN